MAAELCIRRSHVAPCINRWVQGEFVEGHMLDEARVKKAAKKMIARLLTAAEVAKRLDRIE